MKKEEAQKLILDGKKSQEVRRKLVSRTPLSAKVKSRGAENLAQEIVRTVAMPHPIYIESAEGARMTDVDGNTYIDMTMGFGPFVLGLRPPCVQTAIEEQIRKGWHFGIPSAPQIELAALVEEASPCADSVIFANSGTEATMYVMRAARAFTGKPKIATFDGSYHGAHDYALIYADPTSERSKPKGFAVGAGIPDPIRDQTQMVLPYRNEAAFDLIREHKDELAAVIMEPAQNSNPRTNHVDFIKGIQKVCQESDVLFCLDEVVTGFRLAYGGAQERFGITPDLVTYGKALGHGLPIGAVGGREDIMSCFGNKGPAPWIFSGGTFSGNPLSMTAGVAALTEMRRTKDTLYPHLTEQSDRLANEINDFCKQQDIPAQLMHAGSMFHLRFQRGAIEGAFDFSEEGKYAEREFYLHLLGYGVLIPGVHLAFISGAHTASDVDEIIDAMKQSFLDVREDGLL